jgi:uncharacterized membrane protein
VFGQLLSARNASRHRIAVGFAAALLAGIAAATRIPYALHDSLWGDEIASARVLQQPTLSGVLEQVEMRESTPPGWYVLAWVVRQFGVAIADLRLISVLASVLLAVLTFRYALRLMPLWAATLAGATVALGLQLVVHGRELRAYALFALLALLFATTLEAAWAAPTPRRLVLLGCCITLGVFTHYFFVTTLVAGLAWLWTVPATRSTRRRVTVTAGVALLPFLLWLPQFVHQSSSHHTDWIDRFDPLKVAYIWSAFFADVGLLYHRGATVSDFWWTGVARVTFAFVVVFASIKIARLSHQGKLCALLAIVPVALAASASLAGARVFDVRNLIAVAPFVGVVIAFAISQLPKYCKTAAAFGAIGLSVLFFLQTERFQPLPYAAIANALVTEGWRRDQPIAVFGAVSPFPKPTEYLVPPLGWYLPAHPRLVPVPPAVNRCRYIYIVAASVTGRHFLASSHRVEQRVSVASVVVARLPAEKSLANDVVARGASFLHTYRPRNCRWR